MNFLAGNNMKILNKALACLLLFVVILFPGCITIGRKEVLPELTEVFIDREEREVVFGKFGDQAKEMLKISELPLEGVFRKGTPHEFTERLFSTSFRDVKLSPNKKYIAFSIQSLVHEWSGLYDLMTKEIEVWSYFFDHESGYLFWSPNSEYLAEEVDSLKEGYNVTIGKINGNRILTIGDKFLQDKGIKGIETINMTRDGEKYNISYEVKFIKWAEDSCRIFFKIVPRLYYGKSYRELTQVERQKIVEKMEKISEGEKDKGVWSVDIHSAELRREE